MTKELTTPRGVYRIEKLVQCPTHRFNPTEWGIYTVLFDGDASVGVNPTEVGYITNTASSINRAVELTPLRGAYHHITKIGPFTLDLTPRRGVYLYLSLQIPNVPELTPLRGVYNKNKNND